MEDADPHDNPITSVSSIDNSECHLELLQDTTEASSSGIKEEAEDPLSDDLCVDTGIVLSEGSSLSKSCDNISDAYQNEFEKNALKCEFDEGDDDDDEDEEDEQLYLAMAINNMPVSVEIQEETNDAKEECGHFQGEIKEEPYLGETEEADPLSQTSTSKLVMETAEKAKKVEWKREPTHLLIETHGIYNHLFNMGTVSNVEVWRQIASVLQDKGYPYYTPDDCRKKWNSLFYRYKLVKRNKSKRGNKHTKWEHYDVMDDYMTGKPINTPKAKETLPPVVIISKEPSKHLRFVENPIVPPQVATQLQTFPPEQTEETSDKARRIEWKREQTHLLIDAHRTFEHLFIVGNVSSVKVWRKIAKVLQNKGYPYTPDDCRKKWNSLIYRYKLVKRNKTQSGNKRTKWEHYDVMDKYMAGKPILLIPQAEEISLPIDPDHPQPSTSSVTECTEPTPAPPTLHIKEPLSIPPPSLPVAMPSGSSILAKPSPPSGSLSHTPSPPDVLHHPQRKHNPTQLRDKKKMRLEVTEEVLEHQQGSSSKQEHVGESAVLRNALMDNYTREAVKYHQQLSSQLQEQQEQILQLQQQQQSHHEVQRQQILQLQQQSQNQNEMLQQHGMQLQAILGMLQDMQQYFRQERSQGEKKK